jgi:hypothetical protein
MTGEMATVYRHNRNMRSAHEITGWSSACLLIQETMVPCHEGEGKKELVIGDECKVSKV